jgi:IS4 transposase
VVTDGKYSELKVARSLHLEASTILAIDRGYNDYKWFSELTRDGVSFVTRMKTNTIYTTVEVCAIPDKGGDEPILFRRIEYWSADKQEILVFFTNLLHSAASTVAAIYKDRWQIELFFKALKQAAKVKSFLCTSANVVKTQTWTALIAMTILKYLQMKSSFAWSLSNIAALLRQQLFIFRSLWAWLNHPLEGPPAARQLAEQLPMPLIWWLCVGQQKKCKHQLNPTALTRLQLKRQDA